MTMEINYNQYSQDLAEDAVVWIPSLDLHTERRAVEYVLYAPSYISMDFIQIFFLGGMFDTTVTHKPKINQNITIEYTKIGGSIVTITPESFILVNIKRGDWFKFRLKDAANNIVSET